MSEQVTIKIVCDAKTGEVVQVEGPLEMKAFMVATLATALHVVVNHGSQLAVTSANGAPN